MSQTIEFTTNDGESVSLEVVINTSQEPLPFCAAPPHTALSPVVARFLPGANVHGSLDLDFYACTDDGYDPGRLILWVGRDGSQEDDGVARLEPAAWIDFTDQVDGDGNSYYSTDDPQMLAALLLLTLKNWIDAGWCDKDTELQEGDVLDQETLDRASSDAIESDGD